MRKKGLIYFILFVIFTISCLFAKEQVIVFHAGSLSVPFQEIEKEFEGMYPDIDVQREASGSVTAARKISDLKKDCDVIASADYSVIDEMLIPNYADWNIRFAKNEMAIMYTKNSKYQDQINSKNWYEILLKEGVEYGHSDPNADPCGYRTLLVWQLAEDFSKNKGLYEKLVKKCPLTNIRPKETDLLALLDSGQIDYLFIYKSVAVQHKLPYIELPVNINLKEDKYNDYYKKSSVQIIGSKPGEYVTKNGEAMSYGISIIKTAPNKQNAIKFVNFVLSKKGKEIMKKNGQDAVSPVIVSGDKNKFSQEIK
jgi:molybdate/tungstate transport system substrate-binding protein